MGTCTSVNNNVAITEDVGVEEDNTDMDFSPVSLWKQPLSVEETKLKYRRLLSHSNDQSAIQFRALLDDDEACKHFFVYAKSRGNINIIRAWRDLQAHKFLYSDDSIKEVSSSETNKESYIPTAPTSLKRHLLPRTIFTALFDNLTEDDLRAPISVVDDICFNKLYIIYKDFCGTDHFATMCKQLRVEYNSVGADSFEYFEKLSEGAYGFIVHVKKKSTGQHFAMKLQHKALLVRHYKKETHRVVQEMQAIACCNHPFIVGLDYAFQTETLAIMTMPLCVYGDLGLLIMNSPNKRIPFSHVVFYTAEVVLALGYLHKNGIIYRDLKPANILLHGSGHILLADFGAVADAEGIISSSVSASKSRTQGTIGNSGKCLTLNDDIDQQQLPLFRVYNSLGSSSSPTASACTSYMGKDYSMRSSDHTSGRDRQFSSEFNQSSRSLSKSASSSSKTGLNSISIGILPSASEAVAEPNNDGEFRIAETILEEDPDYRTRDRAKSIVGTIAYMAPEILLKFGSKEYLDMTYTKAVDYWSLGVSVYGLIFGKLPFRRVQLDAVQMRLTDQLKEENADPYSIFRQLFGKAHYYALDEFVLDGYGANYNYSTPIVVTSEDAQKVEERAEAVESFIESLLKFTPLDRAGMEPSEVLGELNLSRIKNHSFFNGVDWEAAETKGIPPPPIPEQVKDLSKNTFASRFGRPDVQGTTLNYLLVKYGREKWINNGGGSGRGRDSDADLSRPKGFGQGSSPSSSDLARVSPIRCDNEPVTDNITPTVSPTSGKKNKYRVMDEDQELFKDWYYVSPSNIEVEFNCEVKKGHRKLQSSSSKRDIET